jgi:hypothetical protein
MAKLYPVSVFPKDNRHAEAVANQRHQWFVDLANFSARHSLASTPDTAHIVLLHLSYLPNLGAIDPWRVSVSKHELLEEFRRKCLILDLDDKALPFAPGLYAAISRRWFNPLYHRSVPYIHHYLWNDSLEPSASIESSRFLFSFVGASDTHPCRSHVLKVNDPRGFLKDTSSVDPWKDTIVKREWQRQYTDVIHSSKFVLCPRGRASSSVRLYEVMKAGRVPVVISDDWVPPPGPDWDSFCVFLPQRAIHNIPEILRDRERDAYAMSVAARTTWVEWFSKEVLFDRLVDWCLEIQSNGRYADGWSRWRVLPHLLSSRDQLRRCVLRPLKQKCVRPFG